MTYVHLKTILTMAYISVNNSTIHSFGQASALEFILGCYFVTLNTFVPLSSSKQVVLNVLML